LALFADIVDTPALLQIAQNKAMMGGKSGKMGRRSTSKE